ncbi:MAG: hypothetical protein MUF79_14665 [Burkholderiales bacterium]|jgi:hypothetical protein|nr:hypothetical protein [Burkholderiales bacterium]
MPFTEDFDAFFDTNDFAVAAKWTVGVNEYDVIGLFDSPYARGTVSLPGFESARTTFTGVAADFTGVAHGQTLTVLGTGFTIRGVEPDGTGVVRLVLQAP